MPSIQCGHSNSNLLVQIGPTLQVDIGFDPSLDPSGHSPPNLGMRSVEALVDTGATQSCIDSGIAMQLNLPIIDQRICSGISGPQRVNMHLAQIYIPAFHTLLNGSFAGVNLTGGGFPQMALIGRTFLKHVKLDYDGPTGAVTITI